MFTKNGYLSPYKKISVFTDVVTLGKAQVLSLTIKNNAMHKPPHFQCPSIIIEKLEHLTMLLQHECAYLKTVAAEMSHRQLRNSIYLAVQECNQYALEISGQMQILDYTKNAKQAHPEVAEFTSLPVTVSSTESIKKAVRHCRETELRLITAYREILNEPFLLQDLRVLLRRQYNGVLCAFLQLKLLDGNYIYCSEDYEQ